MYRNACAGMVKKRGSAALSRGNFPATMRMLGYQGDDESLKIIFEQLDTASDGKLGISEIYAWMNGTLGKKKTAREVGVHAHEPGG